MKKIFFAFWIAAALIPVSLTAGEVVRLTRYMGENLTGVSAGYVFRVEMISSPETKAVVEIPIEVEDYLVFEKDANGVVRVDMRLPNDFERRNRNFWKEHTLTLKIYTPTIEYVHLGTLTRASGSGHFTADRTVFELNTASRLTGIDLTAQSIQIKMEGAAAAIIHAEAPSVRINLQGAGKLDLDLSESRDVKIDISGAGKLKLHLPSSDKIDLNVSGAGNATLTGQGNFLTAGLSGAAKMQAAGLYAQRVEVTASAASQAEVYASQYLKVNASTVAKVRYSGNPVEKHISNSNVTEIK